MEERNHASYCVRGPIDSRKAYRETSIFGESNVALLYFFNYLTRRPLEVLQRNSFKTQYFYSVLITILQKYWNPMCNLLPILSYSIKIVLLFMNGYFLISFFQQFEQCIENSKNLNFSFLKIFCKLCHSILRRKQHITAVFEQHWTLICQSIQSNTFLHFVNARLFTRTIRMKFIT